MDTEIRPFGPDDVDAVLSASGGPCISLYMPSHPAGPQIRQDPIRLKNLIREAGNRLSKDALPLLDPARDMLDDGWVWRHMDRGLALFLSPSLTAIRTLPMDPGSHAVVRDRFFIRPLLPLLMPGRRFYLLAIDPVSPGLYAGDPSGLHRVSDETIEARFARIRALTDFQADIGFHPTGPTPTTGGPATAKFHSLGESPDDYKRIQLDEFVRDFAKEIDAYMERKRRPLFVVSDPRLLGFFRRHSGYSGLVEEAVDKNPSTLSEDEMLALALQKNRHLLEAPVREAVERFVALSGAGDGKAVTDAAAVLDYARAGRVDFLLCASDGETWGTMEGQNIDVHGPRRPESDDLIDRAAAETIRHGGSVFVLSRDEMPERTATAAVLRG